MTLVKLTDDLHINPEHVVSVNWERGHTYTMLVITTVLGTAHRIKHDGYTDCYEIERRLLAAGPMTQ